MDKIKIVFVYNADAGKINAVKDTMKKIFNKNNYECNLCGLTFGAFKVRDPWKDFIENLEFETEFVHRDELVEKGYDPEVKEFPCAYLEKDGKLEVFIPKAEMDSYQSIEELQDAVKEKLQAL